MGRCHGTVASIRTGQVPHRTKYPAVCHNLPAALLLLALAGPFGGGAGGQIGRDSLHRPFPHASRQARSPRSKFTRKRPGGETGNATDLKSVGRKALLVRVQPGAPDLECLYSSVTTRVGGVPNSNDPKSICAPLLVRRAKPRILLLEEIPRCTSLVTSIDTGTSNDAGSASKTSTNWPRWKSRWRTNPSAGNVRISIGANVKPAGMALPQSTKFEGRTHDICVRQGDEIEFDHGAHVRNSLIQKDHVRVSPEHAVGNAMRTAFGRQCFRRRPERAA